MNFCQIEIFRKFAKLLLNFDEEKSDFRRVQQPDAHAAAPSRTRRPRCHAVKNPTPTLRSRAARGQFARLLEFRQ